MNLVELSSAQSELRAYNLYELYENELSNHHNKGELILVPI